MKPKSVISVKVTLNKRLSAHEDTVRRISPFSIFSSDLKEGKSNVLSGALPTHLKTTISGELGCLLNCVNSGTDFSLIGGKLQSKIDNIDLKTSSIHV